MIKELFATHVLIKDLDITDAESAELLAITNSVIEKHKAENELTLKEAGENHLPFFTQENIDAFPLLNKIKQYFIDGFYELAQSYPENKFTKELIEQFVNSYTGRLPIMTKDEFKMPHNHTGASAFGILYLSDIDNDKDGGKLVLHDPSWSNNIGFKHNANFSVETKKHRLVIAPANVWHSVTSYTGDENRVAIVFNLDVISLENLFSTDQK
jgi:hypothetical protein